MCTCVQYLIQYKAYDDNTVIEVQVKQIVK